MAEFVTPEQLPAVVSRRVEGLVDVLIRTFPADKALTVANIVAQQVIAGVKGTIGDVTSVADRVVQETTGGVKESARGVSDELRKGPPLPRI